MAFTVLTQPANTQFTINPDENILDAALRQGIMLPYGCRSGSCTHCKATVIEGETRYPEVPLPGVNDIDTEAGEILICQAYPLSDLTLVVREIEQAAEIEIKKMPCRVAKLQKLAPDVMQVLLKIPANERLQFLAGQYISILLKEGKHRSFSLANAPSHDEFLELHIRYVADGYFTQHVFEGLKEKDILRFEGPLGQFTLNQHSHLPIIMVAGGTGFAPIKSIIEQAIVQSITRPIFLYWGVKDKASLYMHELATEWAARYAHIHYIPVLSDPEPTDAWTGRVGLVHEAVLADFPDLPAYEVYAGGPPVMVSAANKAFLERGLPVTQFFSDPFEFQHSH